VLLDATLVRAVLLPASMKLLGRWNWYLPKWLGWLPRHNAVPEAAAAAVPARGDDPPEPPDQETEWVTTAV
jgi:putative drug exporter of the RND superfamily